MAFFEPPPLPEPPERPDVAAKAWWHAPRNELGASSGLRLVVARTDDVAIALVDAIAYSIGVDLVLVAARRVPSADTTPFEMRFGPFMSGMAHGSELPPELLRFGVQFADGRKATSLGAGLYGMAGEEEPEGPLLLQGSGGGADDRWEFHFWLWPLPHRGEPPLRGPLGRRATRRPRVDRLCLAARPASGLRSGDIPARWPSRRLLTWVCCVPHRPYGPLT